MPNKSLGLGSSKSFLIVDASALMHRAYYALPKLTNDQGIVVNAVYGFFSSLFHVLKEQNPQYVVAVFDSPGPTFRHKEYAQYKATRVKAPDDFYAQFPKTKEILKLLKIPVVAQKGYEADDLIGVMVKKARNFSGRVLILTGDFDLLQLVSPRVDVLLIKTGVSQTILYNVKRAREKLAGLSPDKIIDLKGLAGDSSDNIPGVPGVGPKTALRLLKRFGSLENIYRALEKGKTNLKPSLVAKLQKFKNQAFLSKSLATLKTDVPFGPPLAKCRRKGYNKGKVEQVFQSLGFKSLISRLPQ